MSGPQSDLDRLLKARSEIDEELRRHKTTLTILFTDVVGSTSYFSRYGDTAGLAMLDRHTKMAREIFGEFRGRIIKTIGDSVMAQFPEPAGAVRAAVEVERRLFQLNETLPERERTPLRIGINLGTGYRRDDDLFGDAVNVAARITKHSAPGQILISKSVREAVAPEADLRSNWHGKLTLAGKEEQEDVFEVLWTETGAYSDLLQSVLAAIARGEILSPARLDELLEPGSEPAHAGRVERGAGAPGPAPAALPPALTARYEILEEVGRGGMGIVYKARDRETGEQVALKVLKPDIAGDASVMERFKRELRLAHKITHKNVCRIHEFNRADGRAYISMEFVEGESLRALLNRFGGLSPRKSIQITSQICAGLREAHSQSIVHRDLKPENVMLDRSGQVKIMDFGMAHCGEGTITKKGTVVGTPGYMAPEQIQGRTVDQRADLYSVGCVLYEIFTGEPAFTGDTPAAVTLKQLHETPVRPRHREPMLPLSTEQAILKCLEKDPARRFASVDELEAALGGTAGPEPAPVRWFGRLRKARAAMALVALGLAAVVISGVFAKRSNPSPVPPPQSPAPTIRATANPPSPQVTVPPPKPEPAGKAGKETAVPASSRKRTREAGTEKGGSAKRASAPAPAALKTASMAAPKTIQLIRRHQLQEAKLIVLAGRQAIFEESLKGNKKAGFLGIRSGYSGQLSRPLTVPAGAQELSVRVVSADRSLDLSKKVPLPARSSDSPTLLVVASQHRLTVSWEGTTTRAVSQNAALSGVQATWRARRASDSTSRSNRSRIRVGNEDIGTCPEFNLFSPRPRRPS